MKFYSLKTKEIYEEKDNVMLSFLYHNLMGRIILKILTTKTVANIARLYENSFLSKGKINSFIKKNNIDMTEYEETSYKSFNDFFMRRIKKDKRKLEKGLISPCDAKLSVYRIDDNLKMEIKNSIYTIDELIKADASKFKGGYAFIYRLAVDDYHHYIYPFTGEVVDSKTIKGVLHTVQPIALKKYKVFSENTRVVTNVMTKEYGEVAIIEVGAMIIGKIVNEDLTKFKRGDEKGHFEFGGSTIIYLFKDNIKVNKKIIENSLNDIETIVKMGNSLE